MENRKMILEVLQRIQCRCEELKDVVEKISDQDLENILDNCIFEFSGNIRVNLDFIEAILTGIDPGADPDSGNKSKMNNEELLNYFYEHVDELSYI
jgi:hypothetical protein